MSSVARGYSVFDAVRARVRAQAIGRTAASQQRATPEYGKTPGTTGLRTAVPGSVGVGQYDLTFLGDVGAPTPFGMAPSTGVVDLSANPELRAVEGMQSISRPTAAAEANLGYYGPWDPMSGFGRAANSFVAAIDPTPFGFFGGILSGTTTVDPYGRTAAKPSGILGKVAEMNIKNQYEVAEKIRAGTPGFHQFYSGGQLVSITPQTIMGKQVGYATLGTYSGTPQQAINQYAAAMGYDPTTVNLNSRPGKADFGVELDAFVPGSGGLTATGDFVDVSGNISTPTVGDLEAHIGLTADIYGLETAANSLRNANVSGSVKDQMMGALQRGELTAQAVVDKNGNVVGYETGSGSVVRSGDGSIVTSGSGNPVTSGAGIMSTSMYESLKAESQFMAESDSAGDSGVGIGDFGTSLSGYSTVSGRDSGGGGERDSGVDSSGRGPEGTDFGDVGGMDSSDSFFAMGGRVGMQEGGVPPEEVPTGQAPVATEAGFVGEEPEGLPDGTTVADDVPMDVPEGTFVLNAAAVEFMGSDDVKTMILEAMQEAEKQGIDIRQDNTKIPKEELVSLVVSKGEVIIPPQLAQIIGYDRLNKINNRGKAEVEKRAQESAEAQESPVEKPPVLAKSGGFIAMRDGGEVDPEQSIVDYHYNTIQQNKVGRDKEGRPITVYSTSIYIPEGKNKGKFALVPGYVDGSTDYSEDQLYEIWKEEIESGKWPIDSSGEESGKRAQRIHQVMDRDADTMPELKRETPPE